MNKNITAIVFARNEERRLPYVIDNLKGFCNIIVFDGGSTDGTLDYCKKNNIKYLMRPDLDENLLGIKAYRWALRKVTTEYVLHVICSHFYPYELLSRFSKIANENKLNAVWHNVLVYRYGRVVHRPLVRKISSGCNFYKKSIINFKDSKIHGELAIKFDKKTMVRLDASDELSLHLFQDEDCESFTKKTIKYATIEASQRFEAGKRVGWVGVLIKPLVRFIYSYFRTGAFIHGVPGLVYSMLNLIYDFNVNIILWELCHDLNLQGGIKKSSLVRGKLIKNSTKAKK
jgi:glycosyltransferase involved in cell wall biosynthesis